MSSVKEKKFMDNIKKLKNYITSQQPSKDDDILQNVMKDVLMMMLVEEREDIQSTFQKHWVDFMTWLLLEKQLPSNILLGYLKVIQNIIRKYYKRYSLTIDYYFDPTVFIKSFHRAGLFDKHEKNIF